MFQLRKAELSDFDFIWRLRVATMKQVVSQSYGWDEADQRLYAKESLNGNIVLVGGETCGVLTLSDWGDQLHLTWMAISPDLQGRGLGRELIEFCQRQAAEAGKPLTLQVLRNNPAASLYERHGFTVYSEEGPHKLLMRWVAADA